MGSRSCGAQPSRPPACSGGTRRLVRPAASGISSIDSIYSGPGVTEYITVLGSGFLVEPEFRGATSLTLLAAAMVEGVNSTGTG